MQENKSSELIVADSVRYCSYCKEPLEKMISGGPILGMDKYPRMCACQREKHELEQRERKKREHDDMVTRNRSICFEEKKMYQWTFANDDGCNAVIDRGKAYVANWLEMKKQNIRYLFWGPVGTGKSYTAGCIANALIEQEVIVKMTTFTTIIDDMFLLEEKTEYINALARYELLIIDDLGAERSSEYAIGIVFSVIDRRWRSGKPLIITTNLPLKALKEEPNPDKKRIYDRILDMCTPVYVGGESKRRVSAEKKMQYIKSVLDKGGVR